MQSYMEFIDVEVFLLAIMAMEDIGIRILAEEAEGQVHSDSGEDKGGALGAAHLDEGFDERRVCHGELAHIATQLKIKVTYPCPIRIPLVVLPVRLPTLVTYPLQGLCVQTEDIATR